MKKIGIPIGTTHKPSKDGKTLVPDNKRYDLCTQLKKAANPRKKFQGVKPAEREFRG